VLGRDDSCDVPIRSSTVSRRHAQIRFADVPIRAFITDLGTVNGTRLNGNFLEGERPLAPKDTIRLGDVTAVYTVLQAGVSDSSLEETPGRELLDTTVPLRSGAHRVRPLTGDLAGDIALYPMGELLDRLKALQANGSFVIEVDGIEGLVRFEQGQRTKSFLGGLEGEEAFGAISALRRGRFRFVPEAQRTPPTGSGRLSRTPPQGAAR
jgi:pSer/pThr/pTyr-binding forkhead associated (FHA) protein